MLLDTLTQFSDKIVTRFRQSTQLVPLVWKKPRVVRHWLFNARKAQIGLIVLVLMVPFVLNPLIDIMLVNLFAPVSEKNLFGLFITEKQHPYLENAKTIAHWISWILACLICSYLFLRCLPDAVEHARKRVRENIYKADQLLKHMPAESILLYNAATQWNVDENYEKVLATKLEGLNDSLFDQLDETVIATVRESTPSSQAFSHSVIADRYAVKKELGSGAMGNVYLAEDLRLKREVALKQLAPSLSSNKQLIARFRQEAVALARLSHPNIVQVYDFFEADGFFWIVMEFVKGGELEDTLNTHQELDQKESFRLLKQMAEALGYAHQQGVIHRDFKPANVLLTENSDIKVSDFGIAKLAQSSVQTQLNTVMGTPSYMSPEQANGESADERTDIYSLGIIFYQMLAGELPFKGDTKSIIAQHLSKQPPLIHESQDDVSAEVDQVIQKMLAKHPADRYQSMLEVFEQLEYLLKGQLNS